YNHSARKAFAQAMEDVADDGASWRSDDADGAREIRDRLLALAREETFALQLLLELFELRQQRADAGGRHAFADQLILRAARISGEPALGDDFETLFRLEAKLLDVGLPHHSGDGRAFVLEIDIEVAGLGDQHAAEFAAHANAVEVRLHRALYRLREFADRKLGQIALGGGGRGV